MQYMANKSYPEIRVERKNEYYANLLLADYSGINGELTAISQYVFQDFNYFKEYSKFAQVIGKIAMVEMRHLELLGKTIKLLGVKPEFKFKDNLSCFYLNWNSSYVNYYNTDIFSLLKLNIIKEKITIKNYKYHISIINDKYIKRLLERIIEDEQIHIECFQELIKEYNLLKK